MNQDSESKIEVCDGVGIQLIPKSADAKVSSKIASAKQRKKQAEEPMYLNRL